MKKFVVMSLVLALVALVGCNTDKSINPTSSQPGDTDQPGVLTNSTEQITVQDTSYTQESLSQEQAAGRLSSDPRWAVVYEAKLALAGWDWTVTRAIGGNGVSDWNYLANDMNAYNVVKSWYGSYSSGWSIFYSNPTAYGFYGSVGRIGQCAFATNLILYRSGTYQRSLPSYASCRADFNGGRAYTKPINQLRIGDIVRSKWDNGHTAIVVAILSGVEGQTVSSVDVIDGNYVGGAGQEIIGRHVISTSGSGLGNLNNYYGVDLIRLGAR